MISPENPLNQRSTLGLWDLSGQRLLLSGTELSVISLIGFAAAFVILKIFLEKRAAKRLDVRITQIIARKAAPEEKYVE